MKKIILFALFLCTTAFGFAQYKIAVVSAVTGLTKICPTLDSAYNTASAGDYIYLPAGSFTLSTAITKRINFFGAGINPDSSLMGITTITNQIQVSYGSDSSFFEGIQFNYNSTNSIMISATGNVSGKVSMIRFQRCEIIGNVIIIANPALPTSMPENLSFYECVLSNVNGVANGNYSTNWHFIKNLIKGEIKNFGLSNFYNNVFTISGAFVYPVSNILNSNLSNNIFQFGINGSTTTNCIYYNNVNANVGGANTFVNNLDISASQIFVNTSASKWYQNNYKLQVGCPAIGAGTDGFDLGLYGTSQPT